MRSTPLAIRLLAKALALACGAGALGQTPVQPLPSGARPGFTLTSGAATGLLFTNQLDRSEATANANLMNGSGVALGDYDGDGWCDVYFCGLSSENRLFKNEGNWRFRDVTAEAGVECAGMKSTAAVFADLDGDGRLDLVVSSMGGPNACFINQGGGRFLDTIAASGLASRLGGMSMALADVDGNGTLDLYQANYGATSILRSGGALNISYVNGKPVVRGRYAQRIRIIDGLMFEMGEPDALFLNDGRGVFKPVSWTGGSFLDEAGKPLREAPWDQGLSALVFDANGDLAPDIYVCNDAFTPDRFWINDGRGRFRAMPHRSWRTTSHFSMGGDFGDLNRDGLEDFIVADMLSRDPRYMLTQRASMPSQPRAPGQVEFQFQARRNTLFENRGDGTYAEIANFAGVHGSEWSWSCVFLDADLDGWEDILVSNGFPYNVDDLDIKEKIRSLGQLGVEESRRTMLMFPPLLTPNLAFRNLGGMRFEETGARWGFDSTNVSNGFACADLDSDGDLDVAVNCLNAPALVYRNDSPAPRVGVRLKGVPPNTQGIGARIVVTGGPVRQSQQVISGGRYLSGDDPMRVFACGSLTNKLQIEVVWRGGRRSVVKDAAPNHIYEIAETGAAEHPAAAANAARPLFEDASALLSHRHQETAFDDFQIQPGLPNRLSQLGPALAAVDFDRDGAEDLLVGAGLGGRLSILRNAQTNSQAVKHALSFADDITAIAAWHPGPSETEVILGLNAWEGAPGDTLVSLALTPGGSVAATGRGFGCKTAIGALALHSELLFAGGRFLRERYPEPAPSYLYRREGGAWVLSETIERLGVVTAAAWSDLDSDGQAELIVACDWGPVRVYALQNGTLRDRTAGFGLDNFVGRWLSVGIGDFDKNGQPDLVCGNWGENSFYSQALDGQVALYYGELSGLGRVDCVEAFRDSISGQMKPWRDMETLSASLPWLRQRFGSHAAYASADLSNVLAGAASPAVVIRTRTLSTTVFMNRGGRFEAMPLPRQAQYTPVCGVAVADFTGDGRDDVYLAQNFFAVRPADPPLEAGRGLLLEGLGDGRLQALASTRSGIAIDGEQRACLPLDWNRDGRMDLVATQNGGETKLLLSRP